MPETRSFFSPKRRRREPEELEQRLTAMEEALLRVGEQQFAIIDPVTGQPTGIGSDANGGVVVDGGGGGGALPSHEVLNNAYHVDASGETPVAQDLIVRNASGLWARLAVGTTGYVLKVVAGAVAWAQVAFSELTGTISAAQHGALTGAVATHEMGATGGDVSGTSDDAEVMSLRNCGVQLPDPGAGNARYVVGVLAGSFPLPAYYYGVFQLTIADISDVSTIYAETNGLPSVSAGAETANVITVTIQLRDGDGTNLASQRVVRVWLSTSDKGGVTGVAPSGGTTFTTGTVRRTLTTDTDYEVVSNSSGVVVLTITETSAKTYYVMAEHGGPIGSVAATFV